MFGTLVWMQNNILSKYFAILVVRTSLFQIFRVLGVFFPFNSNSNRTFCEETVEMNVLRHLIWVCAVCLCPTKRTIGLYGLKLKNH